LRCWARRPPTGCRVSPGATRGGTGNDLLEGRSGGDIGSGDSNDRLFADALSDTRSFADQQSGTPGNALQGDWLDGGAGDDELVGSADVDAVFGGRGGDRIFAGAGNDFVYGDGEGAATQLSWHRVDNDDATFSAFFNDGRSSLRR
jgi:hypothetical protein